VIFKGNVRDDDTKLYVKINKDILAVTGRKEEECGKFQIYGNGNNKYRNIYEVHRFTFISVNACCHFVQNLLSSCLLLKT